MPRTIFKTDRKENFNSILNRWYFNFFPAYRRTGARVCFMSADIKEIHVKLRLYWATRNYVGTVFGGSIYGAVDPIYMPDRPQEVKIAYCSSNKARKLLGYETKTSLDTGLINLVSFIREKGPKPFQYHFDLEIINDKTPKTWTERMF